MHKSLKATFELSQDLKKLPSPDYRAAGVKSVASFGSDAVSYYMLLVIYVPTGNPDH